MAALRVLLDHNVPRSVADAFNEHGDDVAFLSEVLPVDSKDPLVAATAVIEGRILVTADKDFGRIATRVPRGAKTAVRGLSRITLNCFEPNAAKRVREAMSLIELEWAISQTRNDKRMLLVIRDEVIRTHR